MENENKTDAKQKEIDELATRVSHELSDLLNKSPKLYEEVIKRSIPYDSGYIFEYKDEAVGWNHG